MSQELNGQNPLAHMGVTARGPGNQRIIKNRRPTTTDYSNWFVGDEWFYINNQAVPVINEAWVLINKNDYIATWVMFGNGNGFLSSLTGNTGGPVFGDANNNINTVGDGTTIVATGVPGTHTITWAVVGGRAAQSFVATSPVTTPTVVGGTATPVLGVMQIQASHNLSVSAGLSNTGSQNTWIYWTNNTSTWGDLANLTAGVAAVTAQTGDITITASNGVGNLNLPLTSSTGNAGVITQDGTGFANRVFHTYASGNTFVGKLSGNLTLNIVDAQNNTAVGNTTLLALTTGSGNTVVGNNTGVALTAGESNTAVGVNALQTEVGGAQNVAIGAQAMFDTLGAFQNVAIGVQALDNSQGGTLNTVVGHNAGNGYGADESFNIIIGAFGGVAGEDNTYRMTQMQATGNNNIFFGQGNVGAGITVGSCVNNTGVGSLCFTGLTTGTANAAFGNIALNVVSTGSLNTAVGNASLSALQTGQFNVAVGQASGLQYSGGESSNIVIGHPGIAAESNTIRIGGVTGSGSGQQNRFFASGVRGITTGVNDAVAVLIDSAGQLGTVSSSARYKENIKPIGDLTDLLYKLNPVQFNYKSYSSEKINYGLIAEQVDEVMPRLVVYDKNDEPETVKYLDFIPLMLNELQRLNERIKLLETNIQN